MPSINPKCFEKCICSTCRHACHKTKRFDSFCCDCLGYPTGHCCNYKKMPYSRYRRKFSRKLISIVSEEEYGKKKPI